MPKEIEPETNLCVFASDPISKYESCVKWVKKNLDPITEGSERTHSTDSSLWRSIKNLNA